MSETRERGCPKCGGVILLNDAERKASHSFPVCEWFAELSRGAARTTVEERGPDGKLRPVQGKS